MTLQPDGAEQSGWQTARRTVVKYGAFAIKLAISGSLVFYLLSRLEFRLPPMTDSVIALLASAVLLLLLQPVVMSTRWWRLLHAAGLPVSYPNVLRFNWISIFANQFLPSSVGGDAVRIVLARLKGLPVRTVTMTVVFDRAFALLAMFILILALAPVVSGFIETASISLLAVGVIVASVAGLFALRYLAPTLADAVARRPRLAFLQRHIVRVSDFISDWPLLLSSVALSLMVHALSFLALAVIALCFDIDVPLIQLIAINSLVTLAHILPISVAGWGVREGAAVLFFAGAGVDSSTALSISLLAGGAFALASLPGAILWFAQPATE